jgi:hypothetical protein
VLSISASLCWRLVLLYFAYSRLVLPSGRRKASSAFPSRSQSFRNQFEPSLLSQSGVTGGGARLDESWPIRWSSTVFYGDEASVSPTKSRRRRRGTLYLGEGDSAEKRSLGQCCGFWLSWTVLKVRLLTHISPFLLKFISRPRAWTCWAPAFAVCSAWPALLSSTLFAWLSAALPACIIISAAEAAFHIDTNVRAPVSADAHCRTLKNVFLKYFTISIISPLFFQRLPLQHVQSFAAAESVPHFSEPGPALFCPFGRQQQLATRDQSGLHSDLF